MRHLSGDATSARERVLNCLERKGCDRIPVKHEGTPEVNAALMKHFGLSNQEQLLRVLGDDFRYVQPRYCGPELRTFPDDSFEGFWGERYAYKPYEGGQYVEPVYLPFAGVLRSQDLDRSHFPTADWFDYGKIEAQCDAVGKHYAVCIGSAGDMDFINTIGRMRGIAQVLEDLMTENPAFMEILDARFTFYYGLHERTLHAARGKVDILHVGEDLGTQHGPVISMEVFERLFAEKYGAIFALGHRYGAKTMMHSCGCVEPFVPRLIELGLDILDVVQPTTPEMDIAHLKRTFGDRLSFCGSMCVQSLLPNGRPDDVIREVRRRIDLFPQGGLILGPTHAIQVGTPIENILAMYKTAGSLVETVGEDILALAGGSENGEFDLFKLF
jgi:uroporphyrinogen decarboxylase